MLLTIVVYNFVGSYMKLLNTLWYNNVHRHWGTMSSTLVVIIGWTSLGKDSFCISFECVMTHSIDMGVQRHCSGNRRKRY